MISSQKFQKIHAKYTYIIWALLVFSLSVSKAATDDGDNQDKKKGAIVVLSNKGAGKSTFIAAMLTAINPHNKKLPAIRKPDETKRATTTYRVYSLDKDTDIIDTRGFDRDGDPAEELKTIKELHDIFTSYDIKGIIFFLSEQCLTGNKPIDEIVDFFENDEEKYKKLIRSAPWGVVIRHTYTNEHRNYIDFVNRTKKAKESYDKVNNANDLSDSAHQKDPEKLKRKIELLNSLWDVDIITRRKPFQVKEINKYKVIIFHPDDDRAKDKIKRLMNKFKGISLENFEANIANIQSYKTASELLAKEEEDKRRAEEEEDKRRAAEEQRRAKEAEEKRREAEGKGRRGEKKGRGRR